MPATKSIDHSVSLQKSLQMKNSPIAVCKDCDPAVALAIKVFLERWGPYSPESREYPIWKLVKQVIDPAWIDWQRRHPVFQRPSWDAAWERFHAEPQQQARKALTRKRFGDVKAEGYTLSAIARSHGFSSLSFFLRWSERLVRGGGHSYELTALDTLYSVQALSLACWSKQPKTTAEKISTKRVRPEQSMCRLCGKPTELTAEKDEKLSHPKSVDGANCVRPSASYCSDHRPKNPDGTVRKEYLQARRWQPQFKIELVRIERQFWGDDPAVSYSRSGNEWVDDFIRRRLLTLNLRYDRNRAEEAKNRADKARRLSKTKVKQWGHPADWDQIELNDYETSMIMACREESYLLVKAGVSDFKKEVVARLIAGQSQSEVARQLGRTRQAVRKALENFPAQYLFGWKHPRAKAGA